MRISIIFNNIADIKELETSWGFAAVIETLEHNLLFDTGSDGKILLSNMKEMELNPASINAVFLSHIHYDHTGGLQEFLKTNPNVTVYIPHESFPVSFQQDILEPGSKIETISKPSKIMNNFYSTGVMGTAIKEQSLIIDSREGLIVVTGCAHPNMVDIASLAKDYLDKDIYLLMGGFHLKGKNNKEIQEVIDQLQKLGVKKVAPSHCTGDKAINIFQECWENDFIKSGCGTIIEIPWQRKILLSV